MRRWKRLDLLFSLTLCTTTAEVKSLCSGPVGLLKIIDPCDRPLDPAYPWARGAFLGPGLNGCSLSFHCAPEVRNGQGRTNEVRAAVQGDLCPSAAETAYWKLASKQRFVSSRWMMNLHTLAMLYLYFAMLLAVMQRRDWTVKMWGELNCQVLYMLCIELFCIFSRGTKIITCGRLQVAEPVLSQEIGKGSQTWVKKQVLSFLIIIMPWTLIPDDCFSGQRKGGKK